MEINHDEAFTLAYMLEGRLKNDEPCMIKIWREDGNDWMLKRKKRECKNLYKLLDKIRDTHNLSYPLIHDNNETEEVPF